MLQSKMFPALNLFFCPISHGLIVINLSVSCMRLWLWLTCLFISRDQHSAWYIQWTQWTSEPGKVLVYTSSPVFQEYLSHLSIPGYFSAGWKYNPLLHDAFAECLSKMFSSPFSEFPFFFKFNLFYLFLAVLGLCCCARAFSSCGEQGLLFVAVHRLLIVVASLVAEHGL